MKDRILCVDDEPIVLAVLKHQLSDQYDVSTAEGPECGLAAVKTKGPFAVVVADHGMPHMNGKEFLSRVREVAPHTVHVLLTGDHSLPSATEAINDGTLFRFLTKPCRSETVREVMRDAVERYRLETFTADARDI